MTTNASASKPASRLGYFKQFGPGALVAAAFIGPGTVVTASLAGANFGYALLWALVFSVVATIVLQEMAARLGVVTGVGLGENIRNSITNPLGRWSMIILVMLAVIVGNSVYQGGNLSGASMGASTLFGDGKLPGLSNPWAVLMGLIASLVLWSGKAKIIERTLIGLVLAMSIAFIATLVMTEPDYSLLLSGIFKPSLPAGAVLTVVALIGTTVVPYNLFLHAASAAKKWHTPQHINLKPVRVDLFVAIPLGGLISMAIVATAASAFFMQGIENSPEDASSLAQSLEPLFGPAASYLMAGGLFAAGISSAMTAPLASAYALCGLFGWSQNLKGTAFRSTWLTIIVIGIIISSLGLKPISVIWLAQVANGILLPIIVLFIIVACNQRTLGRHRNNHWQNALAMVVLFASLALSARSLSSAFGLSFG